VKRLLLAAGLLLFPSALAPTVALAQDFELLETTIDEVHRALAEGRLTCRELVRGYLDRIAAFDGTGPRLNTIQYLNPRALAQADSLDALHAASGPVGPLHCVPVLLKDQVETADMPTSFGSALFQDWVPPHDATIVTRMEDAGAIVLAKTTMGEFASRYVGSAYGIIRNAYDPTRNPSGSSGGTASGIAANFGRIYAGTHVNTPGIEVLRAKHVFAEPELRERVDVLLDVDGEAPGRLPAEFRLLPQALRVRA